MGQVFTKYYGKLRGGQWVGVDLDGTLTEKIQGKWAGVHQIGKPIPAMVARVRQWLKEGTRVKIYTARASKPEAIPYIEAFCLEHFGQVLKVTNQKDMLMIDVWDDRAVQVFPDTGEVYHVGADMVPLLAEALAA